MKSSEPTPNVSMCSASASMVWRGKGILRLPARVLSGPSMGWPLSSVMFSTTSTVARRESNAPLAKLRQSTVQTRHVATCSHMCG